MIYDIQINTGDPIQTKLERDIHRLPKNKAHRNELQSQTIKMGKGSKQTHSIRQGLPLVTTSLANLPFTETQTSETQVPYQHTTNIRIEWWNHGWNNAYHRDLLHIGVLLLVVLPELLPEKSRPNRIRTKSKQRRYTRETPQNMKLTWRRRTRSEASWACLGPSEPCPSSPKAFSKNKQIPVKTKTKKTTRMDGSGGEIGKYLESPPLDFALAFISRPTEPNSNKTISNNPYQQHRIQNNFIWISKSQYLGAGSRRGFAGLDVCTELAALLWSEWRGKEARRGRLLKARGGGHLRGIWNFLPRHRSERSPPIGRAAHRMLLLCARSTWSLASLRGLLRWLGWVWCRGPMLSVALWVGFGLSSAGGGSFHGVFSSARAVLLRGSVRPFRATAKVVEVFGPTCHPCWGTYLYCLVVVVIRMCSWRARMSV